MSPSVLWICKYIDLNYHVEFFQFMLWSLSKQMVRLNCTCLFFFVFFTNKWSFLQMWRFSHMNIPFINNVKIKDGAFYRTRISWSVSCVCSHYSLLGPSLFYLKCFGLLYWPALISAAELCAALFWIIPWDGTGGGETQSERNGERVTGWEGETGEEESLQGKWMVGMRVEAQWMSCTLGWGVLEVLCRGSRGHSGCDWHQNNISWQTTLVKGRGQASTRRPHLEYQQPFLFMVNSVWLALVAFSFLFFPYFSFFCLDQQ